MAKNVGKFLLGAAITGAAIGGAIAYLKKNGFPGDSLEEDFEDFTDEFEDCTSCAERTYTTIPNDVDKEQAAAEE